MKKKIKTIIMILSCHNLIIILSCHNISQYYSILSSNKCLDEHQKQILRPQTFKW